GAWPGPGRTRSCWPAVPATGGWRSARWTTHRPAAHRRTTERRPTVSRAPSTCLDELSEDLLPGSADSWQAPRRTPAVPVELRPPQHGSLRQRLRAWRSRHLLRQERARAEYHRSRNPERGLPASAGRAAWEFVKGRIGRRRALVAGVLVLHALAAIAGLVVPRVLGHLVDVASVTATMVTTLNTLALTVAGVVLLQTLLTFAA